MYTIVYYMILYAHIYSLLVAHTAYPSWSKQDWKLVAMTNPNRQTVLVFRRFDGESHV